MKQPLLYGLVILLLSACVSVSSRWEEVQRANSVTAYESFIREFPNTEYIGPARDRVEQLKFEQAKSVGTEDAMRAFLEQYPSGRCSTEARKQLEAIAFKVAANANTETAYEEFLSRYPQSDQILEATAKLRKLRYEVAQKAKTVAAYEQFMERYPQGKDSEELRKYLPKMQKWEQAKELGEIVVRMAPTAGIPLSPDGTPGPLRVDESPTLKKDLVLLRQRLDAGADPNLVRIAGFTKPALLQTVEFGIVTGNPGKPVTMEENGITLLEYCKANNLKEAAELLKAHGAK